LLSTSHAHNLVHSLTTYALAVLAIAANPCMQTNPERVPASKLMVEAVEGRGARDRKGKQKNEAVRSITDGRWVIFVKLSISQATKAPLSLL